MSATDKINRFEIFKQNGFTCMFCGAQAPDVQLHVVLRNDRSEDGTDAKNKLLTACHICARESANERGTISRLLHRLDARHRLIREVIDARIDNPAVIAIVVLRALRYGVQFRPQLSEKLLSLEFDFAEEARQIKEMSYEDYYMRTGSSAECDAITRERFSFVTHHPGTGDRLEFEPPDDANGGR